MEIFRALGALVETPSGGLAPVGASLGLGALPDAAEHTELFAMQLVPYASVYLSADGRIGGEARDRVAGYWRAVGAEPPAEPDHLTVLLSGYATLVEWEGAAGSSTTAEAARHRRRVFLFEHLASWLPVYLLKVGELGGPFYAGWARLLSRALAAEIVDLGVPASGSAHLAAAPVVSVGNEDEGTELLDALLAPARSGFVLTRRDLALAARELGIGSRIGERRFMLEAMLRQRPRQLGEWLRAYCVTARGAYERCPPELDAVLGPWIERVETSRRVLAVHLA